MLDAQSLSRALQCPPARASKWVAPLQNAMDKYAINTPLRAAHFLAQVGHESGRLVYVREIAYGHAYEGRKDLGNIYAGDGVRYRGRGLIQVTGRANYKACSMALGVDFINEPQLLELPEHAAMSAAWFWDSRKLNALADKDYLTRITKKINGGLNGIDDRRSLLVSCKTVLNIIN